MPKKKSPSLRTLLNVSLSTGMSPSSAPAPMSSKLGLQGHGILQYSRVSPRESISQHGWNTIKKWCCITTKCVLWRSPPQNNSISFRSKDEHLDKIPWGIFLGEFSLLQAPSNTSKNRGNLLGGGNMTIKSLRSEKISKIIKPRRLTSQGNHK